MACGDREDRIGTDHQYKRREANTSGAKVKSVGPELSRFMVGSAGIRADSDCKKPMPKLLQHSDRHEKGISHSSWESTFWGILYDFIKHLTHWLEVA